MAQQQYALAADLQLRYDDRLLQQLSSDDGSNGTVNDANTIIHAALDDASAQIESHALLGGRYTETDLSDLYTDEDARLIGLSCDLAMYRLYVRRGSQIPESMVAKFNEALRTLEDLRAGKQVFRHAESIAAGKASVEVIPASTRRELDLVSDGPNFPVRRDTRV